MVTYQPGIAYILQNHSFPLTLCKPAKEHTPSKYGSLWYHSWSWLCIRTELDPRLALGKGDHVLLVKDKIFIFRLIRNQF